MLKVCGGGSGVARNSISFSGAFAPEIVGAILIFRDFLSLEPAPGAEKTRRYRKDRKGTVSGQN
jgi:hypothetical protein